MYEMNKRKVRQAALLELFEENGQKVETWRIVSFRCDTELLLASYKVNNLPD